MDSPTKMFKNQWKESDRSIIAGGPVKQMSKEHSPIIRFEKSFEDLDMLVLRSKDEQKKAAGKKKFMSGIFDDEVRGVPGYNMFLQPLAQSDKDVSRELSKDAKLDDFVSIIANQEIAQVGMKGEQRKSGTGKNLKGGDKQNDLTLSRSKSANIALKNREKQGSEKESSSEQETNKNIKSAMGSAFSEIIPTHERLPSSSFREMLNADPGLRKFVENYTKQHGYELDISESDSSDKLFKPLFPIELKEAPPASTKTLFYQNFATEGAKVQKRAASHHFDRYNSALTTAQNMLSESQARLSQSFQREEDARKQQQLVLKDGSFKYPANNLIRPNQISGFGLQAISNNVVKIAPTQESNIQESDIIKISEGRQFVDTFRIQKSTLDYKIPNRDSKLNNRDPLSAEDPFKANFKKKNDEPFMLKEPAEIFETKVIQKKSGITTTPSSPTFNGDSELLRSEPASGTKIGSGSKLCTKCIKWQNVVEQTPLPPEVSLRPRNPSEPTFSFDQTKKIALQAEAKRPPQIQSSKLFTNAPPFHPPSQTISMKDTAKVSHFQPSVSQPPELDLTLRKPSAPPICQLTGNTKLVSNQKLFQIRKPNNTEAWVYQQDLPFYLGKASSDSK